MAAESQITSRVPLFDGMNRIPGGIMLIPLILGSIVGTFFPGFLELGNFTSALFRDSALPLIGILIFATGMQITLKTSGPVSNTRTERGHVLLGVDITVGWLIGRGEADVGDRDLHLDCYWARLEGMDPPAAPITTGWNGWTVRTCRTATGPATSRSWKRSSPGPCRDSGAGLSLSAPARSHGQQYVTERVDIHASSSPASGALHRSHHGSDGNLAIGKAAASRCSITADHPYNSAGNHHAGCARPDPPVAGKCDQRRRADARPDHHRDEANAARNRTIPSSYP